MAFDPSSVSKDLRRINVARNVVGDDHIAISVPTTSGRANDATDASGLSGLGFMNPGGWAPQGPAPGPSSSGYAFSPNYAARGSSPSDQASEGGDDLVSGKKVKFLCSFGGKILPRPSDGTLRYVGGQTRIISVKRDVTFPDLVQKMVDMCGQPVTIKYQLPFEDLDALVSVSCPDDLDNMMEEYHKLLETSPDGSAKLRVFLFTASEVDPAGLVQFNDFQDSGHKYVDAVNGVVESFGVGLTRKESIASAASTQNSDMSASEMLDVAVAQDIPMFLPIGDSVSPNDNASRLQTSAPPVVVVSPHSAPTQPVIELDRTVPLQAHGLQHAGVNFPPPPSPYLTGYTDPHRDAFSCADYQKLPPPQVVYPNQQVLGAPRPVLIQPQYRDNGLMMTQQFIPAVQMTVPPASPHLSMNPNIVQPIVQPRRVVAVPADQSYINPYPPQVGGGYGWHQVTSPDHVPYSEGWMPHQHAVSRLSDCYMCQKALPHAHSDTVVQDQKNSHQTTGSNTSPIYHTLHLDDISRIRAVAPSPNQGAMGITSNVQDSYVAVTGNVPSSRPEDAFNQHLVSSSSQPIQEPLASKPANVDNSPVGNANYQIPEQYNPETLMDYSGKIIGNPYVARSAITHENVRPVELIRENLQTKPYDIVLENEQNKSYVPQYREDDPFEQGLPQVLEREMIPNVNFTTSSPIPQPVQHIKHIKAGEMVSPLDPFEGLQTNPQVADIISPSNDLRDDAIRFATSTGVDNATSITNVNPSGSPHEWVAEGTDSSAHSLFSNQDPWNMMPESHYPPPKPTKITMRRESSAKELHGGETVVNSEAQYMEGAKPPLEQVQTTKGSAEDHIKQQLQATAEGVAASVLNSSVPSNADYSSQEMGVSVSDAGHVVDGQNSDAQIQNKLEAMKIKPEKANFGFSMSDGMGRLQIIKNSDLEELRELGSGTFGTVYHGKWRGTDVAIKRINDRCFAGKASEQERMRVDFWNEAIKLADLHHPNVVAFYGVVLDGPGGSVATVTEYMVNGSLRTALQKNERNLDKRKRLLIAMDVAFGMEYLHSKNIVHFDLKSDNLLVNLRDPHRPICKVGDLGLSKVKCQTLISGGVRGTLPWMAPELLNGSSSLVSEKVDVFSFGIVMWELLTGEEPYADLHYGAIIGGIVSNTLRPGVPENCDANWRMLMERCWSAEPADRPNFTEIANELRAMASKASPKAQTSADTTTKTNV
ncbi:hypothetical protein RND81_08G071000 [Saponaria officinalis]|uniref:Protein kinase domain-containing protein n=1 Tax=Saponaria officinalis TaxID=3572 RepID=A0AAW1J3G1_SAPOF